MIKFSLSLFGIGYISKFPGTIASLVTCIIFYFLWAFIGIKNILIPVILFLLIVFFVSIYLINKVFGDRDSKEIVVDEFIGQSIPLLFWYKVDHSNDGFFSGFDLFVNYKFETWVILSFFLFRFFDILKPFPINLVDNNIKNGFGVMFDDVIAGIFSTIILYLLFMWI
jgi:phosphatidylglycerophosphatase A